MAICTPWLSGDDVAACCPLESSSGIEFDEVAVEASDLLFELSGRLYAGECEATVRPCRTTCHCGWQVLSRGYVVRPYWTGMWWDCEGSPCGCKPRSRVKLSGYPVRAVEEVKIDGDIVDPGTYRLDESRYVTRVRELDTDEILRWPGCQALDLPDTQEGTFSIKYSYGKDPPQEGISAAAELACELYRACDNTTTVACALPKGTTRVTRQGITIERLAFTSWAFTPANKARAGRPGGWNTGMPLVDAFLNSYNPTGRLRRPTFWAPSSTLRYARELG